MTDPHNLSCIFAFTLYACAVAYLLFDMAGFHRVAVWSLIIGMAFGITVFVTGN